MLDSEPPCRPLTTLPKERGPVETVPGRKAETDRVREGISEGFRPAQSERVAPRGRSPRAGRAVLATVERHEMQCGGLPFDRLRAKFAEW